MQTIHLNPVAAMVGRVHQKRQWNLKDIRNFIVGLRPTLVTVVYVVAMLALGLHMYHGVWSLLQTLGLSHPRYNNLRHAFATLITAVVVIGNIAMPVAVLTGWLAKPPAREVPSRADAVPTPIGQE